MTPFFRTAAVLFCTALSTATASASGGTGEYPLPWSVKIEKLMYRSCGCADLCWTAEVRNTQTKKNQSRLHCDCEKLTFSKPGTPDHVVANSCSAINDSDDKPAAIRKTMESLLRHDRPLDQGLSK
jgi:hypothetical protein